MKRHVHYSNAEQDAAIERWMERHPEVRRGPFDNGLARIGRGSAVHLFSETAIERVGGLAVACMPDSYDRLVLPVDDSATEATCRKCLATEQGLSLREPSTWAAV